MNHLSLLAAVHCACYIEQCQTATKRTIDIHGFAYHLLLHIKQTSDAQSIYRHEIQVICDFYDLHIFSSVIKRRSGNRTQLCVISSIIVVVSIVIIIVCSAIKGSFFYFILYSDLMMIYINSCSKDSFQLFLFLLLFKIVGGNKFGF